MGKGRTGCDNRRGMELRGMQECMFAWQEVWNALEWSGGNRLRTARVCTAIYELRVEKLLHGKRAG